MFIVTQYKYTTSTRAKTIKTCALILVVFLGVFLNECTIFAACYQNAKLSFKRIGFVIRYNDTEAEKLALALAQYAHEQNRTVFFEKENRATAEQLAKNISSLPRKKSLKNKRKAKICITSKAHLVTKSDLIVAIGGDGTLLSVARLMNSQQPPPLLGIYKGTLGFLTEFSTQEALPYFSDLLAGKQYTLSSRSLLEAQIIRDKKTIFTGQAANDAVIKLIGHHVLGLALTINNKPAFTTYGDGLIVSTPTGSTAYSLSAGGPLVEPSVPALILTPLNPTGITLKPVVIPATSTIAVEITKQPGLAQLALDSQEIVDLKMGDRVLLKQPANTRFRLITRSGQNYFEVLKDKFKFGSAV